MLIAGIIRVNSAEVDQDVVEGYSHLCVRIVDLLTAAVQIHCGVVFLWLLLPRLYHRERHQPSCLVTNIEVSQRNANWLVPNTGVLWLNWSQPVYLMD